MRWLCARVVSAPLHRRVGAYAHRACPGRIGDVLPWCPTTALLAGGRSDLFRWSAVGVCFV